MPSEAATWPNPERVFMLDIFFAANPQGHPSFAKDWTEFGGDKWLKLDFAGRATNTFVGGGRGGKRIVS
jgi:hypothetical protein